MSTLSVVEKVLWKIARPVSVPEIVRRAGASLPTRAKRPDAVVARDLAIDLLRNGEASRFARVARGLYTLRELAPSASAASLARKRRALALATRGRRGVLRERTAAMATAKRRA